MPTSNSFCETGKPGFRTILRAVATYTRRLGWPMVGTGLAIYILTDLVLKALHVTLRQLGFFPAVPHGTSGLLNLGGVNASIWLIVLFVTSTARDLAIIHAVFLRHQGRNVTLRGAFTFALSRLPSAMLLHVLVTTLSWLSIFLLLFIFSFLERFTVLALFISFEVVVASLIMGAVCAVRWAIAMPLMVIESIGWRSALRRSWSLTSRFWAPIASWIIIFYLIDWASEGAHQLIASSFGGEGIMASQKSFKSLTTSTGETIIDSARIYHGIYHSQWWISSSISLIDNIVASALTLAILNATNPLNRPVRCQKH